MNTAKPGPDPNYRELMKRALLKLEQSEARNRALESRLSEPVAVIGIGCRFPGDADSAEKFWELLQGGVDAISEVPADRWRNEDFYDADPDAAGKIYTKYGGFLKESAGFDAAFFGVSPKEAAGMDPQQRLLLEVTWEAIENAGLAADRLKGNPVGVFVGISTLDYAKLAMERDPEEIDAYLASGTAHSVAAGRLSYFFGWEGPAVSVDTACSSSMVALHLACQSLRSGECSVGIAGGVNRILGPEYSINFCRAGMLAADGRCRTFDAGASGFVRGEGCGIVVLKRLSDAVASGDQILAVIAGSAVNQDGRTSGLTVPNGPSQQAVIRQALKNARLRPEQVSYVEAHGTGTTLGDPIEAGALGSVYGGDRSEPILIGSVKTNIGHLEAAAGMAGFIKVVLSLQHGRIPRQLHFSTPNQHIDWNRHRMRVAACDFEWQRSAVPRYAGISSFGFSGTNAHVLLGEAPVASESSAGADAGSAQHVLAISARTASALQELVSRHRNLLEQLPDASVGDYCHSTNTGRSQLGYRFAVVGTDRQQLLDALQNRKLDGVEAAVAPRIAFLFGGDKHSGESVPSRFYRDHALFREVIAQCDAAIGVRNGFSLDGLISGKSRDALMHGGTADLAVFASQYALVRLWIGCGVHPGVVMGRGTGELVAACIAGILSLGDALKLAEAAGFAIDQFREVARSVRFDVPRIHLISSLSGALAGPELQTADYWERSLHGSKLTFNGVESLQRLGCGIWIDCGFGCSDEWGLRTSAQETGTRFVAGCGDGWQRSIASVWEAGAWMDWHVAGGAIVRKRVRVPNHPFERKRHWLVSAVSRNRFAAGTGHPLLGRRIESDSAGVTFEAHWTSASPGYLPEHLVQGQPIAPGACYVEMIRDAAAVVLKNDGLRCAIEDFSVVGPCMVGGDSGRRIQTQLMPAGDGVWLVSISSKPVGGTEWSLHVSARVRALTATDHGSIPQVQSTLRPVEPGRLYADYQRRGVEFRGSFLCLQTLEVGSDFAVAGLKLEKTSAPGELIPAPLLDACCHPIAALLADEKDSRTWVQSGVRRVIVFAALPECVRSFVQRKSASSQVQTFDVRVLDEQGKCLVLMEGLTLQPMGRSLSATDPTELWRDWIYRINWLPLPLESGRGTTVDEDCMAELESELRAWRSQQPEGGLAGIDAELEAVSAGMVRHALAKMNGRMPVPAQSRLHQRLIQICEEEGGASGPFVEYPGARLAELRVRFPRASAELDLLDRCGRHLADVLTGIRNPLELLFPQDEPVTAGTIYNSAPGARVMNRLCGAAVKWALRNRKNGQRLRILEIGGGTGSATREVLPELPSGADYWFTDISPHFVSKARELHRQQPGMRFQVLDIEKNPEGQGIPTGEMDLVLAANVLHTTADLRAVLANVRKCLAPGGVLVLLESTQPKRWVDLVFGLTEGWWRFRDHDLRSAHPLLPVGVWNQLLEEAGFSPVAGFAPQTDETELLCRQALIVGQIPSARKPIRWLLLEDSCGVGERLAMELKARGDQVWRLHEEGLEIDGARADDRRKDFAIQFERTLLNLTRDSGPGLDFILHLHSLSEPGERRDQGGCRTLLELVQSVVKRGLKQPPSLIVVTRGAVAGPVGTAVQPWQAPTWGLGKVVALEHPELSCRLIDCDPDRSVELVVADLMGELEAEAEPEVLLRGGKRLLGRLERCEIQDQVEAPVISGQATYLVTGGMGSIGLRVAGWLVERGARHLVLVGRSAPSEGALKACALMEKQGAVVRLESVDISVRAEVERLMGRVAHDLPPLKGVFHSAGIYEDRLLLLHRWELFGKVFAAKMEGTVHLHELTRNIPLDHFVLFSSIASVLGSAGLGNYVAANSFLDAFAAWRRAQGLPGLSVNWGIWDQTGMASSVGGTRQKQWQTQGLVAMDPSQVLEAFARVLQSGHSQITIAGVDWKRYLDSFGERGAPRFLQGFKKAHPDRGGVANVEILEQLEMVRTTVEKEELLRSHVRSTVASVLGLGGDVAIGLREGFFDLGMDSLTTMELRNRLQKALRCTLSSTVVFKFPNVQDLTRHLLSELDQANPTGAEPITEESSEAELAEALARKLEALS